MKTPKLTFKPAPELSTVSKDYPSDFSYTYDVAEYKGVTVKRSYTNGILSPMGPYYVEGSFFGGWVDTQKAAIKMVDKFIK